MHEMSLASGILRLVDDAAGKERFTRVKRLRLEAGALAGVEVSALRFALESMIAGTHLEHAAIEIDESPGQAWCMNCEEPVEIRSRVDACPQCGTFRLQPTGGAELRVLEILVQDD